jgi:transposase
MSIVGAFDVHRRQITYDYVDELSGQMFRGQIAGTRVALREWLRRFAGRGDCAFAVEGCTGWRYVVEELARAGVRAHLAEPADTAAARGRKRHAKTDRTDSAHLRGLLQTGRIPESWIPPTHVLEVRALGRLYRDLLDEQKRWLQRVHATLFHHGVPAPSGDVRTPEIRARALGDPGLSASGRRAIEVALSVVAELDTHLNGVRVQLRAFGARHPGCRALQEHYGIGPLLSAIIWAELGDTARFSCSRKAVRHTGLDVTVYSSDGKRSAGHLARQGPPMLRWALFEAALSASHTSSSDHAYWARIRDRHDADRATLSVARKITRWAHHRLRALGDAAYAPLAP